MKKYISLVLGFALLLQSSISFADSFPTFPMSFYGTVSIDGNPAPTGTTIKVYYSGSTLAGMITTTESGKYGEDGPTKSKLIVSAGSGSLSFVVVHNGQEKTGDTPQTYPVFVEGQTVNLNLTFKVTTNSGSSSSGGSSSGGSSSGGSSSGGSSSGGPVVNLNTNVNSNNTNTNRQGNTNSSNQNVNRPIQNGNANSSDNKELRRRSDDSNTNSFSAPSYFPDVSNHWGKGYVEELRNAGILQGKSDGKFHPDDSMTRAEIVKVSLKAFHIDVPATVASTPFSDVTTTAWYAPYVSVAAEKGIISSQGGMFFPNNKVTRAEASKIILKAMNVSILGPFQKYFEDVNNTDWFFSYVSYLKKNNIVQGYLTGGSTKTLIDRERIHFGENSEDVKLVQQVLQSLGYYYGEIHGTFDRELQTSVFHYQVSQNILRSWSDVGAGLLGPSTIRAINHESVIYSLFPHIFVPQLYFKPFHSITRAEIAKIIVLLINS